MSRKLCVVALGIAMTMSLYTGAAFGSVASLNWEQTHYTGSVHGCRALAVDQSSGDIYAMRPDAKVAKYDKDGNSLFNIGPIVTYEDGSTGFTLNSGSPTGLAVDPLTRYLYMSFGSTIYCVDATTSTPHVVYSISIGSSCQNLAISDDGQQLFVATAKVGRQLLRNDHGTPDDATDDQFVVSGTDWTEYWTLAPSDVRGVSIDRTNRVYLTDLATTKRPVRRFAPNCNALELEIAPVTTQSWGSTSDADNRLWLNDVITTTTTDTGKVRCYMDGVPNIVIDPKSSGGNMGHPLTVAADLANNRIVVAGLNSATSITTDYLQSWTVAGSDSVAKITGTVTASGAGTPLMQATVTCSDGTTATTNSDGAYMMYVSAGTYTFTASRALFNSSTSSEITVAGGKENVVDFALSEIGSAGPASLNWEVKVVESTSGCRALAVDQSNGDIYAMRPDRLVGKYDKDGNLLFNIGPDVTDQSGWNGFSLSANFPMGLAVDPLTGYLYMSVGSTIHCVDATTSTPYWVYSITMDSTCQNLAFSDDGQQLFIAMSSLGLARQLLRSDQSTPEDATDDQFVASGTDWTEYWTLAPADMRGVTVDRNNRVYITDLGGVQRPVRRFAANSNTLELEFAPVTNKSWGCSTDNYNDFWLSDLAQDNGLVRCYTDGCQATTINPLSGGGNIGQAHMVACDRTNTRVIVAGIDNYRAATTSFLQSWSLTSKGTITGRVTSATDGAGLANATVATPTGVHATTDSNGNYTLPLYADTYTLTASLPGYQSKTADPVTLVSNGTATVDFVLTLNEPVDSIKELDDTTAYPDGTYVTLSGGEFVVTALPSTFTDGSMYIADVNRVSAIRLSGVTSTFELGDRVTLLARLSTLGTGERQLEDVRVLSQTSGEPLGPFGVVNKDLAGSVIHNAVLIRMWGKVVEASDVTGSQILVIEDGSNAAYPSGVYAGDAGIRVNCYDMTTVPNPYPTVDQYVVVTGFVTPNVAGDAGNTIVKMVRPVSVALFN